MNIIFHYLFCIMDSEKHKSLYRTLLIILNINILWFFMFKTTICCILYVVGEKLKCPYCDNNKLRVTDKRASDNNKAIRRRRECLRCKKRFTTYERIEEVVLSVIKKSGQKEPYDRQKIWAGIQRSCKKLPITEEHMERALKKIENKLKKHKEIKSKKIGDYVLAELKKLDEVAYLRFASIYKSFEDADSFKKELKLLKK